MVSDPVVRLETMRLYLKDVITKRQSLDYRRRSSRGESTRSLLDELKHLEQVYARRKAMHIVKG